MGRDISQAARNTVVMKAQGYINQESGKFIHKGLKALMRDLAEIGLRIGESSVKRLLTQFRKQTADGNAAIDFPARRKGHCGRKSKLTEEVKEVYRELIREYAYSWKKITHAN